MTSFLEERFPSGVAFGALGGPERRTDVVLLASGGEARNARWADSRRRYDASTGIRSLKDLRAVLELFEKARGRLYGFRFRDPFDHSTRSDGATPSAFDQQIGSGDGNTDRFQVIKTYGADVATYDRQIRLLDPASLKVAVDGTEQSLGTDVSHDPETGELVFAAAPPEGAQVTAGFLFDVPVRFDTDRLEVSLTHFEAGDIPSIPLIEIRI
ncbi:TIGR02217 family protein [Roseibium sp.]|uniref:phage distal tail protein, Rcc01695 family n=1 Tax=Roseibium sp. TaxID=1936156 RepID=UPI003A9738F8